MNKEVILKKMMTTSLIKESKLTELEVSTIISEQFNSIYDTFKNTSYMDFQIGKFGTFHLSKNKLNKKLTTLNNTILKRQRILDGPFISTQLTNNCLKIIEQATKERENVLKLLQNEKKHKVSKWKKNNRGDN